MKIGNNFYRYVNLPLGINISKTIFKLIFYREMSHGFSFVDEIKIPEGYIENNEYSINNLAVNFGIKFNEDKTRKLEIINTGSGRFVLFADDVEFW